MSKALGARLRAMHRRRLYRWGVRSETTGRQYITRTNMTEAQARAIDPRAERLDWIVVYRWVADTPEEGVPRKRRRAHGRSDTPRPHYATPDKPTSVRLLWHLVLHGWATCSDTPVKVAA
jgi:hypothetical protein